jgi:hypothetical protein
MSAKFWLATRKGLFACEQRSGGWHVGSPLLLGQNVTNCLADPRDGTLYASLNHGHFGIKLQRSADEGATWQEVAAPKYPAAENGDGPSLNLLWTLEPGRADQPGLLWAGTIPGGLFVSRDRGESWQLIESLWNREERKAWMGGGYDQAGIHSICFDPRDSRRMLVAVSTGGVWETTDDAATWRQTAHGMFAAYMPPERQQDPEVQDVHRMVICSADPNWLWVQHHNGVFRSVDSGKSWTSVDAAAPSGFGFAVAVHPHDPQTAWFVPAKKDEFRHPIDGKFVISRTRDGGKSFEVLTRGLPTEPAYDIVYRHCLDVDSSGQILATGSTTGNLWISQNGGDDWRLIARHLPPIYAVRFAG